MATLGDTLRESRERLGLTLEEAERATRIRTRHLQALEDEAWESLPSPVQARGFLHNYADFLGLDPNAVLLLYVDVLQQRRAAPTPGPQAASREPKTEVAVRSPRRLSSDLVIASLVVLAVMVVLGWGVQRLAVGFRERTLADAAVASPTAELEPTVVPTEPLPEVLAQGPAPLLLEATPTLAPPPILAASGRVNVQLVIERRAWVRVLVDGAEQYAARAAPGEVLEFQGLSTIEVITGNGGGVRAFYQGEDAGLMGAFDEAVLRIWSVAGVVTPTPTATPMVTATSTPSATATATPGG